MGFAIGRVAVPGSTRAAIEGSPLASQSQMRALQGGCKHGSALISGNEAYGQLKWESGTHRVQRVPDTETSGRLHTSTATVIVLAEVDQVLVFAPAVLWHTAHRSMTQGPFPPSPTPSRRFTAAAPFSIAVCTLSNGSDETSGNLVYCIMITSSTLSRCSQTSSVGKWCILCTHFTAPSPQTMLCNVHQMLAHASAVRVQLGQVVSQVLLYSSGHRDCCDDGVILHRAVCEVLAVGVVVHSG